MAQKVAALGASQMIDFGLPVADLTLKSRELSEIRNIAKIARSQPFSSCRNLFGSKRLRLATLCGAKIIGFVHPVADLNAGK